MWSPGFLRFFCYIAGPVRLEKRERKGREKGKGEERKERGEREKKGERGTHSKNFLERELANAPGPGNETLSGAAEAQRGGAPRRVEAARPGVREPVRLRPCIES